MIARAQQEMILRGKTERVDNVLRRTPERLRRAIWSDAINFSTAAGARKLRKNNWRRRSSCRSAVRIFRLFLASLRRSGGEGSSKLLGGRAILYCWTRRSGGRLIANACRIYVSGVVRGQRRHFFLIRLVNYECFARFRRCCTLRNDWNANDQAARICADEQIAARVEGKRARVRLVGFVEKLPLAIRSDGEYLAGIASRDKKSAGAVECEGPDVLRFGFKKYGVLTLGSHFVNFYIGRSGHVQIVLLIYGHGLRFEFRGLKYGDGLFSRREPQDFRVGTSCRIQPAFRIHRKRPDVRQIRIRKRLELRRGHQIAVAAQRHAFLCALVEVFEAGLLPKPSVLGVGGNRAKHPHRSKAHQGESSHRVSRSHFGMGIPLR